MTVHPHGTNARYQAEPCRCTPCRSAHRLYEKRRQLDKLAGRPRTFDAAQVREHLADLIGRGLTPGRIARLTGLHRTSLVLLLNDTSRRVSRSVADTLLQLEAGPLDAPEPGSYLVPGVGTARRLQALLAYGWPRADLAARLHRQPSDVSRWTKPGVRVTAATHQAVRELYAQLESTPGPRPDLGQGYVTRGYLQPGWWDADTIDDPDHVPDTAVDPVGRRLDRRERVRDGLARGLTARQVADDLRRHAMLDNDLDDLSARRAVERDKVWLRELEDHDGVATG